MGLGLSHLGAAGPRLYKKVDEQAMGSKPASSVPSWSLLQFLPWFLPWSHFSFPWYRLWCGWVRQNKPLLGPQVEFGHCFVTRLYSILGQDVCVQFELAKQALQCSELQLCGSSTLEGGDSFVDQCMHGKVKNHATCCLPRFRYEQICKVATLVPLQVMICAMNYLNDRVISYWRP